MTTFVLVHGAWHGGWCWTRLAPLLQATGHTVIAPDLPGHGERLQPGRRITMDDYIGSLVDLVSALPEPVVLVGHSMAGTIIPAVAEQLPDRVRLLVYLCAFLPVVGETINAMQDHVKDSLLAQGMVLSADKASLIVPPETARAALYNDCTEEDIRFALERLQAQPLLPFITPFRDTGDQVRLIPRVYIETLRDRALPLSAQRYLYTRTPCKEIHTLDAGHAAFFAKPSELAGILLNLAERYSGG